MALDESIFSEKTISKLDNAQIRYNELTSLLSDVKIINDMNLNREYSKEYAYLEPLVCKYKEYCELLKQYHESQEMIENETDEEIIELAKADVEELKNKYDVVVSELKTLLIPPDPLADKNIIVEIRAGTGGDEAALFCSELFRMYSRFAELKHWKIEIIDSNETEMGGYKEMIFSISGKKVYENMRFEYGGHRVQRIPVTETNGRVHTSAVTVAILPEAEEADVEIRDEDLRIDVCRSGGAGGQHVNKTESCVRITHLPTGIVVKCEDDRSQHKNKASAMKVLRSRLFDLKMQQINDERSEMRKDQVGSGDRSQKIRTYNFPQNRITDHRINFTLYKLDMFMQGDIEELIEALKVNYVEEQMHSEE